jgi:hypothetical protein
MTSSVWQDNPDGRPRTVAPDGFPAAIMLAIVATAGFFYVSIMPALVSGLVAGLNFTAPVAGRIAACNVYGAAFGAFCAVLVVGRTPWRRAALVLLILLLALDLVSTQVRSAGLLTALRLVHGVCGGLLVGIAYGAMSRTASPDRCFGILMVVQASLGGLGRMFLPRLVPNYGAGVLFLSMAAFSLVALLLLPYLPPLAGTPARGAGEAGGRGEGGARALTDGLGVLAVALAGVFFFQVGQMSVAAYVIELGKSHGFALQFITATVGAANWIAMVGAVLVVVIGVRHGRLGPILIGTLAALAGNVAYHFATSPTVFVIANVTTEIAWFFVIPYLLGLCAQFDRGGRSAALAGLFSKLGLASGPFVASWFLAGSGHQYGAVVNLALGALALSVGCSLWVARRGAAPVGGAASQVAEAG